MRVAQALAAIAILVTMTLSHASASTEPAQAYNLKGMEAYRLFDWKDAEKWFRAALKEDPNHKLANYNLACVLARRLSSDHRTWEMVGADPAQSPFVQLERAIAVDPQAAQKAAHDPDFATVRLTPQFQKLIGADLKDPKLIEILLVAQCEWFGPAHGHWNQQDLMFFENGEVKKRIFTTNEREQHVIQYQDGAYSIQSGVITLRFGSDEVIQAHFAEDGALEVGPERYILTKVGDY